MVSAKKAKSLHWLCQMGQHRMGWENLSPVGNSLHPTDFTRIDEWVGRMKYWLDKGLEELYFFMHMHDEATSPELTVYWLIR